MPKIHEIIVMQMLDDDRFRSSINEALAKAGVEVTIPGRTPVEPAAPYTTPPQPALSASSWRMLTADELIQDGDQWAPLKEPDRWRPVGDSVGTRPSNWTKSHFRRMVGVEQMAVAERAISGDGVGTRVVRWDEIIDCVGRLMWVVNRASGHREIAIIKSVMQNVFIVVETMSGEKRVNVPFELYTLDHDEQWMIGMHCEMGDVRWENRSHPPQRGLLREICVGPHYRFNNNWEYCRIDEAYYRQSIGSVCRPNEATPYEAAVARIDSAIMENDQRAMSAEAMASHSAMNEPQEIQPTEVLPRLRIYAGESLRGVVIGDLVWIGEDPHPAIFRGLLTGSNEFSFDTENGVERARWFVRLEDANPAWLVGHMCRCSDVNDIPLDTSPFVRIVRYLEGDMFPFRETSNAWRYGCIDESHYINLINEAMINLISEAMINLAVDQRIEREAPL